MADVDVVHALLRRVRSHVPRPTAVVVAALAAGVVAGAVTSTPEARLALPLVGLGVVAVLLVRFGDLRRSHVVVLVGLVIMVVALERVGCRIPRHQARVTPEVCAEASRTSH